MIHMYKASNKRNENRIRQIFEIVAARNESHITGLVKLREYMHREAVVTAITSVVTVDKSWNSNLMLTLW